MKEKRTLDDIIKKVRESIEYQSQLSKEARKVEKREPQETEEG